MIPPHEKRISLATQHEAKRFTKQVRVLYHHWSAKVLLWGGACNIRNLMKHITANQF
jgi:hypothetical protein